MSDEDAFLARLRAHPDDEVSRLVYADWLDERGDVESATKADFLRLESGLKDTPPDTPARARLTARLRALAKHMPEPWKAAVARVPLDLCGLRWQFRCSLRWDQLEDTEQHWVRRCPMCEEPVYYSSSIDEAKRWAAMGRCVALDVRVNRRPGDLDVTPRDPSEDIEAELLDVDDCNWLGLLSVEE
jgi:uncharacterized protein (TIGR02996 family)